MQLVSKTSNNKRDFIIIIITIIISTSYPMCGVLTGIQWCCPSSCGCSPCPWCQWNC